LLSLGSLELRPIVIPSRASTSFDLAAAPKTPCWGIPLFSNLESRRRPATEKRGFRIVCIVRGDHFPADPVNLIRFVLIAVVLCATVAAVWLMVWTAQGRQTIDTAAVPGSAPVIEDPGSLRDIRGSRRSLADFLGSRAYVLAFLGVECPLANLYLPELQRLHYQFADKGVLFLAVYAHENETIDRIAMHVMERDLPFYVLRDTGQQLADQLGVTRTPEVCLLDRRFGLRYRGRISDQYGVAHRRASATRQDLSLAIDQLLSGQSIDIPRTTADGCLLNRRSSQKSEAEVTFTRDVAPILANRCQSCHRPEGQAPFSLVDFEEVVAMAEMIREVTVERLMPPWHAVSPPGTFRNDRRLSHEEIDTIVAWVDGDRLHGDEADLPPAVEWPEKWQIGEPDVVLESPEEFKVPADGVVPYRYAAVPRELTDQTFPEDRWVRAAQAVPGTRSVVHHILAFFCRRGGRLYSESPDSSDLIGLIGWAPGDPYWQLPPDVGLRIPARTRVEFELHYIPIGEPARDRSSLGLVFCDEQPSREARVVCALNIDIRLPPGAPHYRAESTYPLPCDARLLAAGPHMHLRGKSMWIDAIYPDRRRERVLNVPRYDFNWQHWYWYAEPPELPKGTKLHAVAHWDNSPQNPFNPDPTAEVVFGDQTTDEMMAPYLVLEIDPADLEGEELRLFVQ